MAKATRRGIAAVAIGILLLGAGAGVGVVVEDALGMSYSPADPMQSAPVGATEVGEPVLPPDFTEVTAPDSERIEVALDALTDATAAASGTEGEATLEIVIAPTADPDGSADGYVLAGTPAELRLETTTEAGATRGIYDLARQIRAARSIDDLLGEHEASALPLRMTDLGAVGVTPDPAAYEAGTDYSHASRAFADVILPEAPYIDERALDAAYDDFERFLRHSLANGFTAVAFPGFVEYVTFDDAPGGPVYAEDDDHRDKAIALREAFAPMWERADELGVDVFLRTDMLALTVPLQQHLEAEFGSLDTENPAFWETYTAGLDELYAAVPALSTACSSASARPATCMTSRGGTCTRRSRSPPSTACAPCSTRSRGRPRHPTARSSSAPGPSASAPSATCTPTRSRTRPCSADSTRRRSSCRPNTRWVTSTPGCRSTTPSSRARSGGSSSSSRGANSRTTARSPTTSGPSTSGRCSACSPPTRRSRARGCGPRTADRGAPAP